MQEPHPANTGPVRRGRRTSGQSSLTGVSLIEATIALPILLLLALGFLNFCYIFLVYCVIDYAASRAVDLASKLEVEIDTTAQRCAEDPATPVSELAICTGYVTRVNRILDEALGIASLVASPSTGAGMVTLVSFEHYFASSPYTDYQSWPVLGPIVRDAAFLRPGEVVRRQPTLPGDPVSEISHPSRPPGTVSGSGWPGLAETWAAVMEQHPLQVRIEAIYRPLFPLASPLSLTGERYGFRRSRIYGGVAPPIQPAPTATYTPPPPTPTRTPVPTRTSTHTPDPAWTPTPTVTTTPTRTPTRTKTATNTPDPSWTATPTRTPTSTPDPSWTATPTRTSTPTRTVTSTPTNTSTPTYTPTLVPTSTPTPPCPDRCTDCLIGPNCSANMLECVRCYGTNNPCCIGT
ncbi:MAG: hypothetical protein DCC75_00015 [Proteobacteria bacterium]|nr:MAG: hypothetical protein DCC75_00015 [Pseudomonadota bacterium]